MTLRGGRRRAETWPSLGQHPTDFICTDTPGDPDGDVDYLSGALADSPVLKALAEGREKYGAIYDATREDTFPDNPGEALRRRQAAESSSRPGEAIHRALTGHIQANQSRRKGKEFP